jgi:exonuclease III
LCQHAQEIKLFIQTFNLDILLVSETHLTERSYITIPNYNIYHTTHPDETAYAGTAVIIKKKQTPRKSILLLSLLLSLALQPSAGNDLLAHEVP